MQTDQQDDLDLYPVQLLSDVYNIAGPTSSRTGNKDGV